MATIIASFIGIAFAALGIWYMEKNMDTLVRNTAQIQADRDRQEIKRMLETGVKNV